jgi:hypothetical protein
MRGRAPRSSVFGGQRGVGAWAPANFLQGSASAERDRSLLFYRFSTLLSVSVL